jgi:hypothetical protein
MAILLITHALPLWFLIFSLFLPRIALCIAWLEGNLVHFHLVGWVPLIAAILVPRILILVLIYQDQGLSIWFLIHAVSLVLVWGGSGHYHTRRRNWD